MNLLQRINKIFSSFSIGNSNKAKREIDKKDIIINNNNDKITHDAMGYGVESEFYDRMYRDHIEPLHRYINDKEIQKALLIDPHLKEALKFFCYNAASGFNGIRVVSAPNKERIQKLINDLINNTQLKKFLKEWIFRIGAYGNGYVENILSISNNPVSNGIQKYDITGFLWLPSSSITRLTDERDYFFDINQAFEQHDINLNLRRNSKPHILLPKFKVTHYRVNYVQGERYGRSQIESTIYSGIYEKSVEMAMELFYDRLFNTPTDIHIVKNEDNISLMDGKVSKNFMAYVEKVSKVRRRQRGQAPARDIFANGDVNVQRLNRSSRANSVTDIDLLNSIKLYETRTSDAMMGKAQNAGDVGLFVEQMRQGYIGQHEFLLDSFVYEFLEVVKLHMLLNGIIPEEIEIEPLLQNKKIIQDQLKLNESASKDYKEGILTKAIRVKIAGDLYGFNGDDEYIKLLDKENKDKESNSKDIIPDKEEIKNFQNDDNGSMAKSLSNNHALNDENEMVS